MLLRRIKGRAAEITRAWAGKIVVCIASGPSLTQEQIEHVRKAREADKCRVIVINDNYLIAPWADMLYFADRRWWEWHTDGREKRWPWVRFTKNEVREAFKSFGGERCTIKHQPMAEDDAILTLDNDGPDGLSARPTGVCTGSNSGHQVLNIAVHSGGNPILLLGYDFRFVGPRSHSHNGHEISMPEETYKRFEQRFAPLEQPLKARGVKVINCSPDSRLTRFGMGKIEECL